MGSILPSITHTQGIGLERQYSERFDDVVTVGKFPDKQLIEHVSKIEVWRANPDRVGGIRFTYKLFGGGQADPLHGRNDGSPTIINLTANQRIVGVYGRINIDGTIGSISFVIFEGYNGETEVLFGIDSKSGIRSYGTFGCIIAIAGAKEDEFGLCSLSFIKDDTANLVGFS